MSATAGLQQVSAFATHTALTLSGALGNFLALIILAGVLFLFAWYMGRAPFVALLLSFYAAYALYVAFPYSSFLPSAPALTALLAHVAIYLALIAVFYIILRRLVVSDFLYVGLIGMVILAVLGAAFVMALAYHVFPVAPVYQFSSAIEALFGPNQYFFVWFAAPAVGLFFLAR